MTITLEDAKSQLRELIARVASGESVVILDQEKPVARLIAEPTATRPPRVPGSAKGMIVSMADDFDAPLEDFKDYME